MFTTSRAILCLLLGTIVACAPVPDARGFAAYPAKPLAISKVGL